jgi:hypothetical protein
MQFGTQYGPSSVGSAVPDWDLRADNMRITLLPEPSATSGLLAGLLALAWLRHRRP